MTARQPTRIERFVPALGWLREYQREWLRPDVVAGLTAGGVVIPQAMAYATVAGLPVQVGLQTCIVPMAVYALLGGARRMSFSTSSTIVALTAAALTGIGVSGAQALTATATLTLMVGLLLWLAVVLRLGFIVECVSELVLFGIKVAVGLTIAAAQLPKLLGLSTSGDSFLSNIRNVLQHLDDVSVVTALLGFGTVAVVLVLRRVAPRVPGPLVALVIGIGLVLVANLDEHGVALIPEVPTGLVAPSLPGLDHVAGLLPYAAGIALMALLESVSVARSTRQPDDPQLVNDQEFIATGAGSVAGSFFGTVPVAGGFSQTLVNVSAGARTQVSQLATVALAVLTSLFLAPLLSEMPQATLGAVVLVAVTGLIQTTDLRRAWRIDRTEFGLALAAGVIALLTNLLVGVLAGVVITYLLVLRSLSHMHISELHRRPDGTLHAGGEGDEAVHGVLVLRVENVMFTGNIRALQSELNLRVEGAEPKPQVLVVDVSRTFTTTLYVMDVFLELDRELRREDVDLWIAGMPPRAKEKAQRTPLWQEWVAAGKLQPDVQTAVAAFQRRAAQ
ncbi:SulP family inorganic anion transporter [Angustibacter luteus]|uniref:SulP family inorganic anion transporter n=1 Tax=Angustibacter luteus TaxID=658456 RepID=A0ABW1JCA6_9ACTN